MKHLTVREIVLCGLFIALITTGTFIRIPVGTDVYTLQFLFTLLAGLVLGARLGAMAVGAYVLLGLLGVPVFASGGGPAYVLQPTFGYLLSFILQAWFGGFFARRGVAVSYRQLLLANLGGMAIVYAIGIAWFYLVSNYVIAAPIPLWTAIFYCGILQAPPDFLLCLAAAAIGMRCYQSGVWITEVKETVSHKEVCA
ncbi:biotin transport system substrate-specific component [Selenomonas ruminantium]|uniref:Biotin transporter n=1 Tax=Selenomonas ruminantium TaxID=971 RepID=A0A1M6X9N0_SELRU|nr:biotin transporter BioY [Selenomonas ruminantium]SHL02569.1 biotin transport system substrate-specific component [Selenomonas ruminantium]